MKKILWILVIVCGLLVAGCPDPAQQARDNAYVRLVGVVNEQIDGQQEGFGKVIEAVSETGLVTEEKFNELKDFKEKGDNIVDVAQVAATEAARVYEEKQAEGQVLAALEALKAGNAASAPVNPYAPLIDGGLAVAIAIAGGYGALKRKQNNVTEVKLREKEEAFNLVSSKYNAHKKGVAKLMRDRPGREAEKIYNIIGEARKAEGIV